jgi:hypothetical protein
LSSLRHDAERGDDVGIAVGAVPSSNGTGAPFDGLSPADDARAWDYLFDPLAKVFKKCPRT